MQEFVQEGIEVLICESMVTVTAKIFVVGGKLWEGDGDLFYLRSLIFVLNTPLRFKV